MSHRLIVETAAQMRRRRLVVGVISAVMLVAGWGLYMLGRMQSSDSAAQYQVVHQTSELDREQLRAENRRLEAENRRLSEQLTEYERSAEVDQTATAELQESLEQMQARVAELKKELAFYRGIVSPEDGGGLRVQGLSVNSADEQGIYNLHLTLIQAMRYDSEISGRVHIQLHGVRDGESVTLTWPDLALDSASKLVFSFEYFQELGGAFRLPDNLEPTRIEVEVDPDAGGSEAITQTYRWQKLIDEDG